MTQSTAARLPAAAGPEVLTVAAEEGVAAYFPAVLDLTERLFPDARRLTVRVVDDPEIPKDRHIVLELEVPRDVSPALAAQRQWNDGLFDCCPAPLVCVFRLSMELVA